MLYKKFISVVILSTYLTALSPYAFGSIMNKIKNYNNAVQNLYGKALWFSSDNKNISDYAIKVADSPIAQSTYGDYAITTFGSIGADDANVIFRDDKGNITEQLELVGSAPEYYFTDMVFIQQKYEEALVDLCYFRAESSWTQFDNNNRPAVDEAIAGTYWVAEQNGVTIDKAEIEAQVRKYVEEGTASGVQEVISEWGDILPDMKEQMSKVVESLVQYYLSPESDTHLAVINSVKAVEDKIAKKLDSFLPIFIKTINLVVRPMSNGLALSFKSRRNDMLALAPQTISPVEIGEAEY